MAKARKPDTAQPINRLTAVILAGGRGTRLGSLTQDLPKPLVEVGGRPVLFHQLDLLAAAGIRKVWLLTGHLGEEIASRCGDGSAWGLNIRYLQESSPRGTAGALAALKGRISGDFLLLSGDVMAHFDLVRLLAWHRGRPGGLGTVILHPSGHMFDSDLVELDSEDSIVRLHARPHASGHDFHNLSVASAYVFRHQLLAMIDQLCPPGHRWELEKDLFPRLLAAGETLYGYSTPEYFKDMGTPERLARVEAHFKSGRIDRFSLNQPRPAVFLDRDGVLNADDGSILEPEHLQLLPGAVEAVKQLNASGWLTILITNQPLIAKGKLSEAGLNAIHARLETLLGREGAWLDAIYFCPHHPESGFAGERSELKIACACRKPGIGLIEASRERFNLALADSYLIGDSSADGAAAQAAGLKFIGVKTGLGCSDGKHQMPLPRMAENVLEAVGMILAEAL